MNIDANAVPNNRGREQKYEPHIKETWMSVERLAVLLGMLAMAFTAGSNWHRIDALDVQMKDTRRAFEDGAARENMYYVRKDVLAEQLNAIKSQLDELKRLAEQQNARTVK